MDELPLLIFVGLGLSVVIAMGNYELFRFVFFNDRIYSSITNKLWFRISFVPFVYFPGLNVIGLLVLLYLRAMKSLDINR